MTRDDLIKYVFECWKPGDEIEQRNVQGFSEWHLYTSCDPVEASFDLHNYEYRINPRAEYYIIDVSECPLPVDGKTFEVLGDFIKRNHLQFFSVGFADAVSNAKPLQEKTDD